MFLTHISFPSSTFKGSSFTALSIWLKSINFLELSLKLFELFKETQPYVNMKSYSIIFKLGFRYILIELGCHCICILHLVQPADSPILYGKNEQLKYWEPRPTFVNSKDGLKAWSMPFCIKMVLSGTSTSSKQTMIAHLLHWTWKPNAATGAFWAAAEGILCICMLQLNCPNLS